MVNPSSMSTEVLRASAWSALSLDAIETELGGMGQPAYRSRQLYAAIHGRGLWDWSGLSEWPLSLRSRAAEERPLRALRADLDLKSKRDGTNKVLFGLAGGGHIESVLMRSGKRGESCSPHGLCEFSSWLSGRMLILLNRDRRFLEEPQRGRNR